MEEIQKCASPSKLKRSNYAFDNCEEQIDNLNSVVYTHILDFGNLLYQMMLQCHRRERKGMSSYSCTQRPWNLEEIAVWPKGQTVHQKMKMETDKTNEYSKFSLSVL